MSKANGLSILTSERQKDRFMPAEVLTKAGKPILMPWNFIPEKDRFIPAEVLTQSGEAILKLNGLSILTSDRQKDRFVPAEVLTKAGEAIHPSWKK